MIWHRLYSFSDCGVPCSKFRQPMYPYPVDAPRLKAAQDIKPWLQRNQIGLEALEVSFCCTTYLLFMCNDRVHSYSEFKRYDVTSNHCLLLLNLALFCAAINYVQCLSRNIEKSRTKNSAIISDVNGQSFLFQIKFIFLRLLGVYGTLLSHKSTKRYCNSE